MGVAAILDARSHRDGPVESAGSRIRSARLGLRNALRKLELDGTVDGVDNAKQACCLVVNVDASFLGRTEGVEQLDSPPTCAFDHSMDRIPSQK
jgi:hypothetical protein